ncbi:MAG: endonuclease domain-containing protein, partial [Acidimicrobiales bacterium]
MTIPHGQRRSLPGVVVHQTRRGVSSAKLRGIPVTSPVATIADLAQLAEPDLLEGALDRGHRKGLVTGTSVLAELERRGGRGAPGVATLRALLAERGYPGIPASALERRTRAVLRQGGLPDPVRELATGPGRRYRVDFSWPPSRVMVEVDGFDTHGTPEALRADLARQNELVAMGWAPLRYTWQDICRRPKEVVA